MLIPGRMGLTMAVKPAAAMKKINQANKHPAHATHALFRLQGLPGDETAMPPY